MQWHKIFSVAFLALILSACGDGVEGSTETTDSTDSTTDSTDSTADSTDTTTEATDSATDSSVAISARLLTCPSDYTALTECSETSNISSVKPGVLAVYLAQGSEVLGNELVTATTTIGTLSKETGLTDENGLTIFNLTDNSIIGGGRITLTTDAAEQTTSGTLNFEIIASYLEMTIENNTAGLSLAQDASALITVNLSIAAQPYTSPVKVTFTSGCVSDDANNLDESIMTTNGVAQAKYQPNSACVGDNVITGSIDIDGLSESTTVTLDSFPAQSINYSGASPEWIAIKGTGGVGRKETSVLTFEVVNTEGSPVGAGIEIEFTLSGPSGSIIYPKTDATDENGKAITYVRDTTDENGEVTVYVSSGKVSGVVRVTAKLVDSDPLISSVSDQLAISTGLPDQNSFSLSLSDFAPSAWNHDGEVVDVTVRLADHWNNTVPDGTAVYFQTEGGKIQNSGNPTGFCLTVQGTCSVVWESAKPRPNDGLSTITAWALGEESFADKDGDGWFTDGDIFTNDNPADFNDKTDLGEVFFDYNNNNAYDGDSIEEFVVFDIETNPNDQQYTVSDDKFTGILCSEEQKTAGNCAQSLVHVRMNMTLAMASDEVSCKLFNGAAEVTNSSYDLSSEGAVNLTVVVQDINGNTPPTGTTINIETLNGQLNGTTSFTTFGSNINARKYQFTLDEDEADDVTEGLLTVKMVTPKNSEEFTCELTVIDDAPAAP